MSCNSLYVKKISLKRNEIENFDIYPFNVEIVSNFEELHFISPVSFFVGENGIGKSTFIEAIAVACGLNPEGGTQNFNFDTKDTHSNLHEYLTIAKFDTPKMKYFLRAESFYNVSSEIQRLNEEDGYYGIYDYYVPYSGTYRKPFITYLCRFNRTCYGTYENKPFTFRYSRYRTFNRYGG